MGVNAQRDPVGGIFATARRGGLTPVEVRHAHDLREKGRGVQTIANILGRSMEDVHALFSPPEGTTAAPANDDAPVHNKGGQKPKAFTDEQIAILRRVDNGHQSARSACKDLGCSITAVRTWVANNRTRREERSR